VVRNDQEARDVTCMLHAMGDGAYFLILRVPELCRVSRLLSNRKISCFFNALSHDTLRHKVTLSVTFFSYRQELGR
jgi:hypothetical protein